jgi:hypothetical protein
LSIESAEALGDRRVVLTSQSGLAHIYRREADLGASEQLYRLSIVGWRELGRLPAVAHQIECFAYIALERGRHRHAAELLGAAAIARERLDAISGDPQEIEELAEAMDRLAEAMGEEERDKVLAEGRLISLDDAVQLALDSSS